MEQQPPHEGAALAEKLTQLADMEAIARSVLELAMANGDRDMEQAARLTLQRASSEVAALADAVHSHASK